MKKTLFSVLLSFSALAWAQNSNNPVEVTEFKLDNGLTVMLSENPEATSVFGMVVVKAGGKNDPADATGIAHYLEHMLFKGTQDMGTTNYQSEKTHLDKITELYEQLAKTDDPEEIARLQAEINEQSVQASQYVIANEMDKLLAGMGGTAVNAYTTEDYTVYLNNFPSSQMEKWLEVYSHRFEDPVFRLFQSELETVYEEKNRAMDDRMNNLIETLLANCYKNHPYGQQTILGSVEHLKKPSLQKMYEFYNTYYVANNMALVLSGNFEIEKIKPLIETKFGSWKSGAVPEFPKYEEQPFEVGEELKMRTTPVKLGLMTFRSPANGDPDLQKFKLALSMLSNMESTGILDELSNEGDIMAAEAMDLTYNDYGIAVVFYVPKLIGQKLGKAQSLVNTKLDALKSGDFSDELFNTVKLNLQKEKALMWESNYSRATEMAECFTQGKSWEEYYMLNTQIENITKEEVIAVANKYFTENYLLLNSKMGFPKKEKLEKPGFSAVIPKSEEKSAFAKHLEEIPATDIKPKFVDFDKDIAVTKLNERFTINQVRNPYNEVFDLEITYGRGTYNDPKLEQVSYYMSLTGTKTKTVSELNEAFARLGASYYFYAGARGFSLQIEGLESNLEETLKLVQELMDSVAIDEKKVDQVLDDMKTNQKFDREDLGYLSQALNNYVLMGDQAPLQRELTKKQLKELTPEDLVDTYKALWNIETTVNYVGNIEKNKLAALVETYIYKTSELQPKQKVIDLENLKAEKTVIYLLEDNKAVQSQVRFNIVANPGDRSQYGINTAFNEYFDGGMSGLVFQEIREFRSLAYSAYGYSSIPNVNGNPIVLRAYIGCQADKTIEAIQAMQVLLEDMPRKPERMELIQSSLIEKAKSSYPSFRNLASYYERWLDLGYTSEPMKQLIKEYQNFTFEDITTYYEKQFKGKPIVITIVGNPKQLDMEALKQIGEVIIVNKKDLFVN